MNYITNNSLPKKQIQPLFLRIGIILLFWFCWIQAIAQQTENITGKVVDVNGNSIPGANVVIKGTTQGAITDTNGNFSLTNVKTSDVLQIHFIGYENLDVPVNNKTKFRVVLHESNESLNEVVIVGYGSQKKESVIGAIATVDTEDILKSSSANISQAISGKMPGVITTQTSGSPGNDDVSIYIRGQASFASDNQPLILVDGVEREFSQIAPDDIASISVLKDASATAVYGVRGANGVILVTTKRGQARKPVVSFTATYQLQSPTRGDRYLNSYQSVKLLNEALENDGLDAQYDDEEVEMYRLSCAGELSADEEQLYPNVDWYQSILRKTSPSQRYNLNIQGGSKRMRYYTSLEYYRQNGLYKDQTTDYDYDQSSNVQYTRYGFRANIDFDATSTTLLSVNFGTRFEERNEPNITDNKTYNEVFYELNRTPGWLFPIQYENGYYGGNSQYQNNIAAVLGESGFKRTNNTINETNFILNQKLDMLIKGLSFKGMVSFDYNSYYTRSFTADFAVYELIDRDNPDSDSSYTQYNLDSELAYDSSSQTVKKQLYMEYGLNYTGTFGKNNFTGLLLYDQSDSRYQADIAERYQGFVGRVTYNYDERYFGEFNGGYNGSENFAKGNRFGFFPAFSVGWMLSNESFMKSTEKWMDSFKIRASYGEVGNDKYVVDGDEVRFLYDDSWSWYDDDYQLGDGNYTEGVYEGEYPNYDVTWERAKKYNLGFDTSFKSGKLLVNVDLFRESRKNILTDYLTVPEYVGVSRKAGNLGRTTNQGYEIEVKHNGRLGSLKYNVAVDWSHAHNTIKAMDEPSGKPTYRRSTGHPINQCFGLICEGYITQDDIDSGSLPTSSFVSNVQVGDLKYKDMNEDGYIDENDETQIGYSIVPENTFSLSLGAQWRHFDFNCMFSGVTHVSRFFDAETLFAFQEGGKVREEHLDRWDPNESESYNLAHAKYPLLHYDEYGDNNQQGSSFFLKNGNFVRLKNIELGYQLPKSLIEHGGMSECRIYVSATNLFTWDKLHKLTDPESTSSNVYPICKSVNCGINIKF